jgi:UDP-N-acetylmuramoylalanine--D-glutamate ligase
MRFEDLRMLRVGLLGMGREGQAVWHELRRRFPDKPLAIFTESALDEDIAQQLTPGLDSHYLGPLERADLAPFDVFVRSAGISPYREPLIASRARGARITTATNLWFAENPGAKTVCISGTAGKSTTSALLAHLLGAAGLNVRLAGNIGRPMLGLDAGETDWWVIELSSYQITDFDGRPDMALLLNISQEHLDWHRGFEAYVHDKLRLAKVAGEGRVIANFDDRLLRQRLAQQPGVHWFNHPRGWRVAGDEVVGPGGKHVRAPESLPGHHNLHNLAAVLTTLDRLEIEVPDIGVALDAFHGLPHRLQLVGRKDGVRYVNDSISTTPVTVTAALETIGHRDVVLLLGGMDRGLDWDSFAAGLAEYLPHAIIALPDNGPKILASLERAGLQPAGGLHRSDGLEEAVALARELAPAGGTVLLSPGAPSFPHFRDYEERGARFAELAGIEKGASGTHKKGPRDGG